MFEFEISGSVIQDFPTTRVTVIGVGGAGNNTVNALISTGRCDYNCIALNTDAQTLELSSARQKLRIGTQTTQGRGAGADPALGKAAAEEDLARIVEIAKGTDIAFLVGGLGGGTGSGALPVIARALKEQNILTVCIVTKPFNFEGKRRMLIADQAVELLKNTVDTLIIIPNEKLSHINHEAKLSWTEACGFINGIVADYIHGIVDIIMKPGHINVDLADIKTIMKGQGTALMGTARARGDDRALQAADAAINSPFLENLTIRGAHNVLINITGDHTLSLQEIQIAAARITEDCHEHATVIIGSVLDETCGADIAITVIATGLPEQAPHAQTHAHPVDPVYHPFLRHHHTNQPVAPQREQRAPEPMSPILTKEHPLRDMLPSIEKRLKEQYALSLDELEMPTLLRTLNKEQSSEK